MNKKYFSFFKTFTLSLILVPVVFAGFLIVEDFTNSTSNVEAADCDAYIYFGRKISSSDETEVILPNPYLDRSFEAGFHWKTDGSYNPSANLTFGEAPSRSNPYANDSTVTWYPLDDDEYSRVCLNHDSYPRTNSNGEWECDSNAVYRGDGGDPNPGTETIYNIDSQSTKTPLPGRVTHNENYKAVSELSNINTGDVLHLYSAVSSLINRKRCHAKVKFLRKPAVENVSGPSSVKVGSEGDFKGTVVWNGSRNYNFEYKFEVAYPDGTVVKSTNWNTLGGLRGSEDVNESLNFSNLEPSNNYKGCITARDTKDGNLIKTDCTNVDVKGSPFIDMKGDNDDGSEDNPLSKSWGDNVTLSWNSDLAENCTASYEGGSGQSDWDKKWPPENGGDVNSENSDGHTVGPIKTPGKHRFNIDCDGTVIVSPDAPSNLQAEVTAREFSNYGYVDLTWKDNSKLETSFEIHRYENNSWDVLATIGANKDNEVTYRDNSVQYGERYTYRVRACNGGECSSFSNSRGATVVDSDQDGDGDGQQQFQDAALNDKESEDSFAVKSLKDILGFLGFKAKAQEGNVEPISDTLVVEVGDGPFVDLKVNGKDDGGDDPKGVRLKADEKVTVTWSSSESENCKGFINPSSQKNIDWGDSVDSSNEDGVEVGPFSQNYEGEIGIGCDYIGSDGSNLSSPSDLKAKTISTSEIELSWIDNSDSETRFEIEGRPEPGPKHGCGGPKNYQKIGEVSSDTTKYEDSGLADGGNYCYRVKACNDLGCSKVSNYADGVTYLENPTNFKADANECSVTLTWSDNSENEDKYQVFRNHQHIDSVEENTTFYSDRDSSLNEGSEYSYSVRACNSIVCSSMSNYDFATYTCNKGGGKVDNIDSNNNFTSYKEGDIDHVIFSFSFSNILDNYNPDFISKLIDDVDNIFSKTTSVEASNHYELMDTVPIYVESNPPVIDSMGPSHNLVYNQEHTHSPSDNPVASASDPDGDLKNYKWSFIRCADYDGNEYPNCPALTDRNGNISGGSADIEGATYTPKEAGHYTLELEVTDEVGNKDTEIIVESTSECSDGIDNEGDGLIDYGDDQEVNDPDCDSLTDDGESAETPSIFDFFFEER